MKKVLSLVLVIALVLGSFSFAFGMTDMAGEDNEVAVQTLVSLGIVNGYKQADGTYKYMPAKAVKRAEMAKILIEALGYGSLATGTSSSFSDVAGHWAEGYIEFASGLKIINGYPDGTFRPEAQVSYNEALTMVLRALGYTDAGLQGSWPTNYVVKALDLDLTDGVTLAAGGADRGGIAQVLFNALEVDTVTTNNDGDVTTTGSILIDKLGAKSEETTISLDDVFDADDKLDSKVDLTPNVFHKVTVYKNADGEVVYVTGESTTEKGEVTTAGATTYITLDDEDDTVITLSSIGVDQVLYNGAPAKTTTNDDLVDGASVTIVYTTSDKTTVAGIVVEEVTATKFITEEYDVEDPDDIDGITLPTTKDDDDEDITDLDNVVVKGDATSLEDIAVNDVVYVYEADDTQKTTLEVVRNTFTGTVTEKKSNGDVVVDGEVLDFNADVTVTVDLGEEYTFALDADGDIFDIIEGEAATVEYQYGIIVDVAEAGQGTFNTIVTAPQIKLETADGEKVYDLAYNSDNLSDAITTDSIDILDKADMIAEGLTTQAFIAFDLNSDGEISKIVILADENHVVQGSTEGTTTVAISGGTYTNSLIDSIYIVTDDTNLIENAGPTTIGAIDALGTTVTGIAVYNSDDEVVAMSVEDKGNVEDSGSGVYALVIESSTILEGDDEVTKYVVLEDGIETVYTSESNSAYDAGTIGSITASDDFTLDVKTATAATVKKIASNNNIKVNVAGVESYKTLSDDVDVYVLEDSEYSVGSTSDLEVDADIEYLLVDGEIVMVIVNK